MSTITSEVSSIPYWRFKAALNSGLARTACSHSICSSEVIVGCTPGTGFQAITVSSERDTSVSTQVLVALSKSTAAPSLGGLSVPVKA